MCKTSKITQKWEFLSINHSSQSFRQKYFMGSLHKQYINHVRGAHKCGGLFSWVKTGSRQKSSQDAQDLKNYDERTVCGHAMQHQAVNTHILRNEKVRINWLL